MTAPSNVAVGDQITASGWNAVLAFLGGTPQTYTPTLTATTTNPTLGTGATQNGTYIQIGQFVMCWVHIQFGSSGAAAGSGTYQISLPVSAGSSVNGFMVAGHGEVQCAGTWTPVLVNRQSSTIAQLLYINAATNGTRLNVTNSQPGTFTNNDRIDVFFAYTTA